MTGNLVCELVSSLSKKKVDIIRDKKVKKRGGNQFADIMWLFKVVGHVRSSSSYFAACHEKDNLIHLF